MAKTLLEEIFNQVTGRRSPRQKKKKLDQETQKFLYEMRKNVHKVKQAYNEAQTRAYIKGWKK